MQHKRPRIAVIGGGAMGSNHIKTLKILPHVDFVGVVEIDPAHHHHLKETLDCPILTGSLDDITKLHLDGVIIATPSSTHYTIAKAFLENNVSCLVEKPLALTLDDCASLNKIAQDQSAAFLMVGHSEEFNQGFLELKKMLKSHKGSILSLEFSRFNYASQRITDTNVIMDLMSHDIGCMLNLLEATYEDVKILGASGFSLNHTLLDHVTALLHVKNIKITLNANRLSHKSQRTLVVTTSDAVYELDFMAQNIKTYEKGCVISETHNQWAPPLLAELNYFVETLESNKPLFASGLHGENVVRIAQDIKNHCD